jgi:hypothetical protein
VGFRQFIMTCHVEKPLQPFMINQPVSGFRVLNFMITAPFPFRRMIHNTGSDHIQINIYKAPPQMVSGFYRSRMITVFPESAFTMLAMDPKGWTT